jgi:hypothetical protein
LFVALALSGIFVEKTTLNLYIAKSHYEDMFFVGVDDQFLIVGLL